MLLSVTLPNSQPVSLWPRLQDLRSGDAQIVPGVGFAVFDAPSHSLPNAGVIDVQLVASLDGRRYRIGRALDAAERWQVHDVETGWLAASGPTDVQHWLRASLDIPQERPLPVLFREIVCFSLPASFAWLLEEPGLRERKLADLLSMERYPAGLRWLDGVVADSHAATHVLECAVYEAQGQDALFEPTRQRLESARAGELAASDSAAQLRQQLEQARGEAERYDSLRAESAEVQQQLHRNRAELAVAEAQLQGLQRWLLVNEQALQAMDEHRSGWQEHQQAEAETAQLANDLAGVDSIRAEQQTVRLEVLILEREQVWAQEQLARVEQAESAAAGLVELVQSQHHLEQQVSAAHERALRLELVGRGLQGATADAKRLEILVTDVERQLTELEQVGPQAARVKKLSDELERQRQQLRDANRQVDQLRFLEGAIRAVSGHAEDLRKSASISERLAIHDGGNGIVKTEERTVASHLRQAVDNQLSALERQLQDWRGQVRELADAPQKVDQWRSTMHQLQEEIDGARQVEIKLGAIPALKQQRKQLREHFEQLTKSVDAYVKEQRECAAAAAQGAQLRQELGALGDPRSEQQALLRQALHKKELETELREIGKRLDERRKRQSKLEEQLAALAEVQQALDVQLERSRCTAPDYREYLTQQAVVAMTASVEQDVATASTYVAELQQELDRAEAAAVTLDASLAVVEPAPARVAALQAQLGEAELRASDFGRQTELGEAELAAAEANRQMLDGRKQEVELHARAEQLLLAAREVVRRSEVELGTHLRQELAIRASSCLRRLLGKPEMAVEWPWGEPPSVVTAAGSHGFAGLDHADQACAVLAVRLALAAQASRFGTVFVSGLGSLLASPDLVDRLRDLPDLDQLISLPAW